MSPLVAACIAEGAATAAELMARGLLTTGPEEVPGTRAEITRGFQMSVAGVVQGKGAPAADFVGLSLAVERTTWREQYRSAVLRAMLPTVGVAS